MWLALDDVNYDGGYLHNVNPQSTGGSNTIYPVNLNSTPFRQLNVNYDISPVRSSGNPIGIPSSGEFVDHVYHVEMAEFQMWTGVTLDTSAERSRRAFIELLSTEETGPVMRPAPPSKAESLLGKKPDVLLHGSTDWILGANSGSASKKFTSTGKIKPYVPDPNLGGKQGDPQ